MKSKNLTPYFNVSNMMGTGCIAIVMVKSMFYPASALNLDIAILFAGVALHGYAVFQTVSVGWKGVYLSKEKPSEKS